MRVTAGARFTSDEKRYAAGVTRAKQPGVSNYAFGLEQPVNYACGALNPARGTTDVAQGATANALAIQCGRDTFDFATFRGAIDYKITPDSLLYASASTGRRSGGFNNVLQDSTNPSLGVIAFQPEKVTAFEIGTKNQFFDRALTLNIAAFYNKFSGLQVQRQVTAPNLLTTFSIIENSGKGRSYGLEVEAVIRPVRALTIGLTAVYLNSKFTEYETGTAANGLGGLLGCPVAPAARDYTCEAGGFSPNGFPFLNGLSDPDRFRRVTVLPNGNPVFNYIIAGGPKGYKANIPLSPKLTLTGSVAYEIDLGAAGTITPSGQIYYNDGFDNLDLNLPIAKQKSYTKSDVRLTYASENSNLTVQAFVENIENEAILNRTAIGANRSINAVYGLPRTYGIRAGVKF